ncbi:hypothetical protein L7F22_060276 [Adiantum nelumboides]|nr:hypothetical protein [Adiantum nelumboides]
MHHLNHHQLPHSPLADTNPPSDSANHPPEDGLHYGQHEKHMEAHANESDIAALPHHAEDQMKGSNSRLPLHTKYNSPSNDYHHHVDYNEYHIHVEHDAANDPLSHHKVARPEDRSNMGGRIAASTLQAARAQAAELRALHSAVLNNHNSLGTDVLLSPRGAMPFNNHLLHYKSRANKKESKIHNHITGFKQVKEDVHIGALSSASSASSTADCFIRPLHEYPVFTPHSQEDILSNTSGDDINSLNRRSSVDTFDAAMMREERLHYIFDHDNKTSFSAYIEDNHGTPIKGNTAAKYVHADESALQDFTSRQRALIEFLSEEPARMRAFNELAAKEAVTNSGVHQSMAGMSTPKQKSIQKDIVLPNSAKATDKFEPSGWNADGKQSGTGHHHHPRHQKPREPAVATISQMRHRLAHTLHNSHLQQASSVSFEKCKPTSGVPTEVFPLTDANEACTATNAASNVVEEVVRERPEQLKKPSIKGWFFRSKKKPNNADQHSTNLAYPYSNSPASGGTFSVSKEQQSVTSTSAPTSAPTSHVFSGLATSETEKELEVAMAMDLMELKVLQANTKRDAAMAEVLELRLAMDSMAKKLVEVERHCESLKYQLLNVQALQKMHLGVDRDAGRFDHGVDLWMHPSAAEDHDETAAADRGYEGSNVTISTDGDDEFCESDSHENREERKAAANKIRAPGAPLNMPSSSYRGGRSSTGRSRNVAQPKKEEFFSAVAEARVGVKQVSRVLLQHVQESVGRGLVVEMEDGIDEAAGVEQWRPILTMCREARKAEQKGRSSSRGSGSRSRDVGYCIEALISLAFYEHFENVGFDKNGAHHILDPAHRALAFYHSFLKLAKLTPTQLLTQTSALYNPAFDRFCSRKMRALGRVVGCPGRLWPDELACTFLTAARAIWLLHQLAFAYPAFAPAIFRVAAESPFDPRFMELLPTQQRPPAFPPRHRLVSLMVMPGFFLSDDVIKCKHQRVIEELPRDEHEPSKLHLKAKEWKQSKRTWKEKGKAKEFDEWKDQKELAAKITENLEKKKPEIPECSKARSVQRISIAVTEALLLETQNVGTGSIRVDSFEDNSNSENEQGEIKIQRCQRIQQLTIELEDIGKSLPAVAKFIKKKKKQAEAMTWKCPR